MLPVSTPVDEEQEEIRDQKEKIKIPSNELTWRRRKMLCSKTDHFMPEEDTLSLLPEEEEEGSI